MAPVSETFANLPSSFKQGWNEAIYPSPAQRAGMRERVEKLTGRQARIALLAILEGKPVHEAIGSG